MHSTHGEGGIGRQDKVLFRNINEFVVRCPILAFPIAE